MGRWEENWGNKRDGIQLYEGERARGGSELESGGGGRWGEGEWVRERERGLEERGRERIWGRPGERRDSVERERGFIIFYNKFF